MRFRQAKLGLAVALLACALWGCHSRHKVGYFGPDDPAVEYYKEVATQIDQPCVKTHTPEEVQFTDAPRRIRHPSRDELWDMPLVEALHTALANSEVIRERGQFLSTTNRLLTSPNFNPSVYDPAIQESGILFGQRGVEAALADFDALFTTSTIWGRDEQVSNNPAATGGVPAGAVQTAETAAFNARLEKVFATGGQIAVNHNWDYRLSNNPGQLFPSVYTGQVNVEYRHPLWAGSGIDYTRVAGPFLLNQNLRQITGVSQGVLIARINNDISLADFQAAVRNLLKDAEDLYWELALAYRVYDSEVVARNSALRTWREVKARADVGAEGGGAAEEAQARDNYYETRARAENALTDLYSREGQLRRLLGLPVNDGRVIRPIDEPVAAEFVPDWQMSLVEALTQRVELRRQKWNIKSLELQVLAADSLTTPRLDFISSYNVNGFGDDLIAYNDNDGLTTQGYRSAYGTLTQGEQTGWNLGFEFEMPIGFRKAHSQVRNLELQLAKARAMLAAQELEVSHELAHAFRELDRFYQTAVTNFNRRRAAQLRVQAYEAEFEAGRTNIDLVLRSQISLAQAEIAYYQSLMEYNKAIAGVHYRKGTLLEHNHVFLAENEWNAEAYEDALQRAMARTYALPADYCLHTEPPEFATQHIGLEGLAVPGVDHIPPEGMELQPVPTTNDLEAPPAPAPPPTSVDEASLSPSDASSSETAAADDSGDFAEFAATDDDAATPIAAESGEPIEQPSTGALDDSLTPVGWENEAQADGEPIP